MRDDIETAMTSPAAPPAPTVIRGEDGTLREEFVDSVRDAVEKGETGTLRSLICDLHESDVGSVIEALDPNLRPRLVELMGPDFDFTALTEVDDTVREEILEELPSAEQAEILGQLPVEERNALTRILEYPENSAGRLMQSEIIAVKPHLSAGQAIDYMRETPDLPDRFWELYVVDEDSRLVGAVALDRLLRSKHAIAISDLFEDDLRSVRATDDQEAVARLFERYDLVAAPVVDDEDRLVGVITFDDIVDVIEEEAEEDIKALGGVSGGEELSDSVLTIARSRFPWLAANLLTALLSSWVISNFQSTLEKMVALAVLMPIVASMGGNAGTQTMTVTVRALATRELPSANTWRIIRREVLVGVLNGLAFAV